MWQLKWNEHILWKTQMINFSQEETDNLNCPMSIKRIEIILKKHYNKEKSWLGDCINELYQILKEEIWQFFTSFSKNWRVGKTFQLTIYSQHYFETETRQRFYNITYEYTVYYCCCLVAKSWSTLCNPMDSSSPGFPIHWTSHLRILEWVAISFSRGSSRPRDQIASPALAGGFFTAEPPGKPILFIKN